MNYADFIHELRSQLPAPRVVGVWRRWWVTPTRPGWLKVTRDEQNLQFDHFPRLLSEGEVVWGYTVQANYQMWQPGKASAPGTVIFSFDIGWSDPLLPLTAVAQSLGELKDGSGRTPEEKRYGAMLDDEMERAMDWHAPTTRTGGRKVRSTSLYFDRRQMPDGYLARSYFPLLAHPEIPAATLVPLPFWSRQARRLWNELDAE